MVSLRRSSPLLPILSLAVLLAGSASPHEAAQRAAGATPFRLVPPGSPATRLGIGRGAPRAGAMQFAPRHFLVRMNPRTDLRSFAARAGRLGLKPGRPVRGTSWLRLSVPPQADLRAAARAAARLPGVVQVTRDPIVRINDTVPNDPFFKDDPDPSVEPCDPLFDETCDPMELVDQWNLFKVGAPQAWDTERGSPGIVIAVTDTGVDQDHDDLWGNLWTNPDDSLNGLDDDGNGLVDDVHGADFCGENVGDPWADDPASHDGNPDIASGGFWIEDETAYPFGVRFVGDPAVGDAVDNDFDGFLIDGGVFHGTMVAGIAGAMTNNLNPSTGLFEGMAGTAWNCKIMPVRVLNAEGWGFGSDAAEAIRYATDEGAHIINASWGISIAGADAATLAEVAVIADAVRYAASRGVIVVAAAGNGGSTGTGASGLDFPGLMPETISVGSSNWLDQRSEFSSTALPGEIPDNGVDDDGNGWVDDALDVVAPGEIIWSTYVLNAYESLLYSLLGLPVEPGEPTYSAADGTSFATPLVSGYVALLLSQNPGADLAQVRSILRGGALDLTDPNGAGQNLPGYDHYSGFGRVRMRFEGGSPPPPPPPPPTNLAPVLSVTGEPGYTSDGISRDSGNRRTTFVFRVRYQDADGDAAAYVRLRLVNRRGRLYKGREIAMQLVSGTPAAGAIYQASLRIRAGRYSHSFVASDGQLTTAQPDGITFTGPTVRR